MDNTKKKNKLGNMIENLKNSYLGIVKLYPITIVSVFILSLIASILMYDNESDFLSKCMMFLLSFSAGSFLTESITKSKTQIKFMILMALNVIISAFYTWEFSRETIWFFGIENETMCEQYLANIYILILASEASLGIYFIFKNSGVDFFKYCTNAFTELFKTSVIYSVFAVGFLIVTIFIDILLFDTGVFIGRLEIVLLGAVLAPLSIRAITVIDNEVAKFAKIMILFVLMPLLTISFAVIYLYIVKIVFTWSLPANQVFYIIAFLFAIGMPIWTMAQNFKDSMIGKISRFYPFAFIPLIILQAICMSIRVSEHGITSLRYMGYMLIIFEIIYVVLYILHIKKEGEHLSKLFIVAPIMLFIALLAPGINVYVVTLNSQKAILTSYLEKDDLTKDEKYSLYTAYREIRYSGWQGKKYIEDTFSEEEIETISEYGSYMWYNYDENRKYYSFYKADYTPIDVAGYSVIYESTWVNVYGDVDLKNIELVNQGNLYHYTIDIEEYILAAIEDYKNGNNDSTDNYICDYPFIDFGDFRIYIKRINIEMDGSEIISFSLNYMLMEK